MKSIKDSSIRVRIDRDIETKLKQLCEVDGTTPSAVLRKLLDTYVAHHPLRDFILDVIFKLTNLPNTNPHAWYVFEIEVELQGKLEGHDLSKLEIPFLLPEFFDDDGEPFRVDSVYNHRMSFPNCTGKNARFIGAKVVERKWKGAIYVYRDSLLNTPEVYENLVKEALKKQILLGVGQHVKQQVYMAMEKNVIDMLFDTGMSNERVSLVPNVLVGNAD